MSFSALENDPRYPDGHRQRPSNQFKRTMLQEQWKHVRKDKTLWNLICSIKKLEE